MVSKVFTRDLTSLQNGGYPVGLYFRKEQAGGDSPRPPYDSYLSPSGKRRFKRRRVSYRLSEPHAYSMTLTSYRNVIFHLERDYPGYGADRNLFSYGFAQPPNPWNSNDDLELLGRLQTEISGAEFNLAVTLGESRETLELIAHSAYRLAGALLAIKKGNVSGAAKHLGIKLKGRKNVRNSGAAITSAWLELKYGWMPLLQDIHSAAELLAYQLQQPQVRTYRARLSRKSQITEKPGDKAVTYGVNTRVMRKQIVAHLREKPSTASLLGFTNPLSIAWELTPLSFVPDWVYPVSNYLAVRGFFAGLNATYVQTSKEDLTLIGINSGRAGVLDRYTVSDNGATIFYHTVTVNRTIATSLAVPKPSVVPFTKALSWQRAVTALSLLNNLDLKF